MSKLEDFTTAHFTPMAYAQKNKNKNKNNSFPSSRCPIKPNPVPLPTHPIDQKLKIILKKKSSISSIMLLSPPSKLHFSFSHSLKKPSMSPLFFSLFTLLLALFSPLPLSSAGRRNHHSRHQDHSEVPAASDLVRTSCVHANYPNLCLRTLSAYSGPAPRTPRDLAKAAVNVSLARASRVSEYLAQTAASAAGSSSKGQKAALSDCLEQMGDSVDELRKTLDELEHLQEERSGGGGGRRGEEFRWQMSNAETWVSAALTNEDTCLDGFQEVGGGGKIKADVRRKITNVARVTSNALYMINRLDQSSRHRSQRGAP